MQRSMRLRALSGPFLIGTGALDDDLAALVKLLKDQGRAFSGVDAAQLDADAQQQRDERTALDAAWGQFEALSMKFAKDTDARTKRWKSALDAARGAFKNDAEKRKLLLPFKRSVTPEGTAGAPGATPGP